VVNSDHVNSSLYDHIVINYKHANFYYYSEFALSMMINPRRSGKKFRSVYYINPTTYYIIILQEHAEFRLQQVCSCMIETYHVVCISILMDDIFYTWPPNFMTIVMIGKRNFKMFSLTCIRKIALFHSTLLQGYLRIVFNLTKPSTSGILGNC